MSRIQNEIHKTVLSSFYVNYRIRYIDGRRKEEEREEKRERAFMN